MKYCQNCGAKMNDDAIFCLSCGAAAPEAATMEAVEQSQTPAAKNSNKLIFIILGVAALAILAVVLLVVVPMLKSDNAVKDVAKNYVEFLNDRDYDEFIDLTMPKPVKEYFEDTYHMKPEALFTEQSMGFFTQYDQKYGNDWTATYEIQGIENLPENDLKQLQNDYDDLCDMEITDAKNLKFKVFFDEDQEKYETVKQTVYKYGDKWYIYVPLS